MSPWLSDLVADLPEPLERTVLKAMAHNSPERYADVPSFLQTVETVSLSSPSLSTSPLTAPVGYHLGARVTEPLEIVKKKSRLPTTGLLERPQPASHEHDASITVDTEPCVALDTLPSLVVDWAGHADTVTANIIGNGCLGIGSLQIDEAEVPDSSIRPHEPLCDSPPIPKLPQQRAALATPTLWLAFALSSVVLLMGTVMLYAIVPERAPASTKHKKSVATPTRPAIHPTPTVRPESTPMPTMQAIHASINNTAAVAPLPILQPPVQASLTGSYAEQGYQTYNLTADGQLDWMAWGLNASDDVNHKHNVQQMISTFNVIGNSAVEQSDFYENACFSWSDGVPVASTQPRQSLGIYVTGLANGFTITVAADTKPRILRLYVGANQARGKLSATIDGRTYIDGTLDTRHIGEDNGVYTLIFNGNAPHQVLTVKYTAMATNGNDSSILLQAATLGQ